MSLSQRVGERHGSPPLTFFPRFRAVFEEHVGVRVDRRSVLPSSRLHGVSAVEFGVDLVRSLFNALDGPWWAGPSRSIVSNWKWRDRNDLPNTTSEEVRLERAICREDPSAWTYQMPTASGLRGTATDKRRCIDLVRKVAPESFELIELKVGSDSPLFAIQEVLGYGLAYLHARANGYANVINDAHGVLSADRIGMVVLGPDIWYSRFLQKPGAGAELGWLVDAINAGLATERFRVRGLEHFAIGMRTFEWRQDDIVGTAARIARTGGYAFSAGAQS